MEMSSGLSTSAMFTIEETEMLPSFTSPSIAMCEWQSIMPGMTNWPAASITCALLGAFRFGPTSVIFPSLIRTEPCSMVPCETVMIVAFWIRRTGAVYGVFAAAAIGEQMRPRTQIFRDCSDMRVILIEHLAPLKQRPKHQASFQ